MRRSTTLAKRLELDADYAWAHHNLANALQVKGRLDEALAALSTGDPA